MSGPRSRRRSAVSISAAIAALVISACAHVAGAPDASVPDSVVLQPEHVEPDLVMVHHRVEPGQTLYRIAKAYGISVDELMDANGIADPRGLTVGQELVIPGAAEPASMGSPKPPTAKSTTTSPDGRPGSAETRDDPNEPEPTRPALTKATVEARPPARSGILQWPLRGVLYARFGRKGKEAHDGIDLAAPVGTPVATAAEGTVLYAGEQRGYGLIVIINHTNGLVTLYAHNRDLRAKTGQKIKPGQVIATVGESGRTSGPHLHFEVRKEGVPVNPLDYLGAVPAR